MYDSLFFFLKAKNISIDGQHNRCCKKEQCHKYPARETNRDIQKPSHRSIKNEKPPGKATGAIATKTHNKNHDNQKGSNRNRGRKGEKTETPQPPRTPPTESAIQT